MSVIFRDYADSDEQSWLRCRVLGLLDTAYFDDVWTSYPRSDPGLSLVAVQDGQVVGICQASLEEHGATIDTVVVHPDHRRAGIASALFGELKDRLARQGVGLVDAWTRDDPGTLDWYRGQGFTLDYRYLHVYASTTEEMRVATSSTDGLTPLSDFFHADTQDPQVEATLRTTFTRVHACHRFVTELSG